MASCSIETFSKASPNSYSSIVELQYADDKTFVAHTEGLQCTLNAFARASRLLGLTMNIKKTKILHQPLPASSASTPTITVDGEPLENVCNFPILGNHLSSRADIDSEIHLDICCASGAFAKLRETV